MNDDGKAGVVGGGNDIFLTINGKWFSRLAIFSKPVGAAIRAFCAIVRRRRRVRVIAKRFARREVESGLVTEQELEAFIRFACETLPKRPDSGEDARDVLIASLPCAELKPGSRVGTSSLRRQVQLRHLRHDLELVPMRGNLDTRLRKLDKRDCDALVLAAAGLHRLALGQRIRQYFAVDEICPAVGQGALAIEIREDNDHIRNAVRFLDDPATHCAVRAERAALRRLGGGCQAPIAAHARLEGGELHLVGMVARSDGSQLLRLATTGSARDPDGAGTTLAEELLGQGARSILDLGF